MLLFMCKTMLGQSKVKCEEGVNQVHGEGMDTYYTQANRCTYGNILIKDETMEDAYDCKFTCHTISYYLIKSGKEVKVTLEDLFKNGKSELLSKINTGLKKDFQNIVSNNSDCFVDLTYNSVTFGSIKLFISKDSFIFSAPTHVAGYCEGPAGVMGTSISLKEMDKYL